MFSNLKSLKTDMLNKGWVVDAFNFQFNNKGYVVIVELYKENERKPDFSLVKLDFIDISDLSRHYRTHANSKGFINLDVKSFRFFFDIPYSDSLGDVIETFKRQLGETIPSQILEKNDLQKKVMVTSLSKSDLEDPNKIHPTHLQNTGNRTVYNSNKASILINDLYEVIIDRKQLSVCFSADPTKEKSAQEILVNYGL